MVVNDQDDPLAHRAAPPQPTRLQRGRRIVWLGPAGLLGLLASRPLHDHWWAIEAAANWSLQAGAAGLLISLLALWRRAWWPTLISALAALLLISLELTGPRAVWSAPSADDLQLSVANIYFEQAATDELIERLDSGGDDLLCLIECRPEAIARLQERSWRFQLAQPATDPTGIAIFSRRWARLVSCERIGGYPLPVIDLDSAGGWLRICFIHPPPPVGQPWADIQRRYLDQLISIVQASPHPVIAIGDWNLTQASPRMKELQEQTGLRRPHLISPASWPSPNYGLGLAIDHCLISPDLAFTGHELIDLPGSDHRGQRLRLLVPFK